MKRDAWGGSKHPVGESVKIGVPSQRIQTFGEWLPQVNILP